MTSMTSRQASKARATKETEIKASVNLDGTGTYNISTGIGFLILYVGAIIAPFSD